MAGDGLVSVIVMRSMKGSNKCSWRSMARKDWSCYSRTQPRMAFCFWKISWLCFRQDPEEYTRQHLNITYPTVPTMNQYGVSLLLGVPSFHSRLSDLERKAAEFDDLGGGIEFDSCLFACQMPTKRARMSLKTIVHKSIVSIVAA